ncbi:MAG TPA: cupin domain-containing protein [Bacteroidales bacterium]|nr:cupin domain-containing protein [Bacteroidales bacterium]
MEHTEVKSIAEILDFSKPDEVREFPKGRIEIINHGDSTFGKAVFQPGWKWSESVKPIAKTHSCEAAHVNFHISGELMVVMDDGSRIHCKPGDVSVIAPGHDAWVVGREPAVMIDFQGMKHYAK